MEKALRANIAYPEVVIDGKNLYEAKILMNLYGGMVSETTAIMQYIYGHYIFDESDPELSDLLLEISLAEMEHHDLLGETIWRLGGTPVIGDNRSFWNGASVNYATNPISAVKANIKGEQLAIADYEKAIKLITNPTIKALLERIIIDEELHLATLEKYLEKLES